MKKIEFDNLCIHDLRTYAREIGVASPTIKNKQLLIDEIKKIQKGTQKPYKSSRRGRPPLLRFRKTNEPQSYREKYDDLVNTLEYIHAEILKIIKKQLETYETS